MYHNLKNNYLSSFHRTFYQLGIISYLVFLRPGNEFTPPMTIPGLKVCNEFITSKTFLLEFANYKTFINNKTFVGPLTRMAGKRDVMTFFLLCDVTAISRQRHPRCCYANVKLQQKCCFNALYFFSC